MTTVGGGTRPAAFLLPIGLGAGNIGDELINRVLWQSVPEAISLAVPLFGEGPPQRAAYPDRHRYLPIGAMPQGPAMLVGGTISDAEGVHFPLQFLAPRLTRCHQRGWWVEAHGVGVDPIRTDIGRQVFQKAFLPLRKWTVRSEDCREALLELSVPAERIVVAADWAWLHKPAGELRDWARRVWREWGRDEARPLVVVNIVQDWEGLTVALQSLASQYQVALYSNDTRVNAPDQRVAAGLHWKGLRVPPESYAPEETIALLAEAHVVVAQRYHTAVEAALGGARIVLLSRPGRKIHSLGKELGATVLERAQDIPAMVANAPRVNVSSLIKRAARLVKELPRLHSPEIGRKHALVVHMGGLGDMVLAAGFFAGLRRRFDKVTLLCRQPVAAVVKLMPEGPHEVVTAGFDPYREATPTAALEAELARFGELETPDILVSAEFKPTWLSWYLAALLDLEDSFQTQPAPAPNGLLTVLLERKRLNHRDLAAPPPARYPHERDRYAALARWLNTSISDATWNRPAPAPDLAPGSYIACFPGGAAHIKEKTWGAMRFRQVLENANLPVVLVGDQGDLSELQAAAPQGSRIIVGNAGTIDEVAAVVANARAWIGNDSGLAHLAQAYRVPGVVPFGGGGGWPVYGVWGEGSIGLVCELDCFGCEWACAFEQTHCLEQIPVSEVTSALHRVIDDPLSSAHIRRLTPQEQIPHRVLGGAARKHRELRAELARRMDAIVELEHGTVVGLRRALAESQESMNTLPLLRDEADNMRLVAQQRLEMLDQSRQENEALRTALEELQSRFQDSSAVANTLPLLREEADNMRLVAQQRLEMLKQSRQENDALRTAAEEIQKQLRELRSEADLLCREAEERERALVEAAAEANHLRHAAAERLHLLNEAQQEIEQLRKTAEHRLLLLNEAHAEMGIIRQAAAERLNALEAQAAEAKRNREEMATIEDLDRTQQG
ncbi:MAG: hypothetical protein JNN08_18720 [Bryobacterales bacterium]|nr:hypothetical protein [Bryobacterales bacterium]